MGGLGHFLEQEGLATTQISLIREHTERIKPPRALWVPFELGRPFGAPNDAVFQERVLLAALRLLEVPGGPVLADYPEEAPCANDGGAALACPLPTPASQAEASSGSLDRAFLREMEQMMVWHQEAQRQRGRTTYGISGLEPMDAVRLLLDVLAGLSPKDYAQNGDLASTVKLASEDIKALYQEAVVAQPGGAMDSAGLLDWFYGQTSAGQVFLELSRMLNASQDPDMRLLGTLRLIPVSQAHRK